MGDVVAQHRVDVLVAKDEREGVWVGILEEGSRVKQEKLRAK